MDIVNELYDTFIGDYMFAWLFPASLGSYDNSLTTNTSWQYEPATKYFSIPPSQAAYMSAWPRDNIYRQMVNLFLIAWIFGLFIYLIFATLSYTFLFDKETMKHPKYLENQVWQEIKQANIALPCMSLLTLPIFLAELRGLSRLYESDGPGLWWDILQIPLCIIFTDFCIYWIHRGLHHPRVYRTLHKPHHKWIIPTPYASHAFHPVDGFAQSVPYHIFPFIVPLHKLAYLALFVFVNFWAIFIHDGEYVAGGPYINGAACHTIHHLYFNYNYGQYTTLWDRLGKSYRNPNGESLGDWKKVKEAKKWVVEVEGEDNRTEVSVSVKKNK